MNQATTKSGGFFCYQRGIKKGFIIDQNQKLKFLELNVTYGN